MPHLSTFCYQDKREAIITAVRLGNHVVATVWSDDTEWYAVVPSGRFFIPPPDAEWFTILSDPRRRVFWVLEGQGAALDVWEHRFLGGGEMEQVLARRVSGIGHDDRGFFCMCGGTMIADAQIDTLVRKLSEWAAAL